jgi:predicted nucleic acid-binding protein
MIMFDTDMLSLYFNGRAQIQQRLDSADEDPVVSIVSRIEVLQGRFDSVLKAESAEALLRAQQRLAKAEEDLARYTIVPFDMAAGNEFDRLRQNKKLKKIGRKDLLIACIALANQATLVTRNVKDFQLVPGLRLENWAD